MESIFSIYIYIYIRYILNKNHIIFSALLYFVTFIELNNAFHTDRIERASLYKQQRCERNWRAFERAHLLQPPYSLLV